MTEYRKGQKVRYTSPATDAEGRHYQYETVITRKRTMKATGQTFYSVEAGINSITADMLEPMEDGTE